MSHVGVCVPCGRALVCAKNEVSVEVTYWSGPLYNELFSGDLWRCPDCGRELILGIARQPFASKNVVGSIEYDRIKRELKAAGERVYLMRPSNGRTPVRL